MIHCYSIREALALDPHDESPDVQAHVAICLACAAYHRRHETLDVALRAEIHWEAPLDLTASLLKLAALPLDALPEPKVYEPVLLPTMSVEAARSPLRMWQTVAIYSVVALAMAGSALLFWQLFGMLFGQIDMESLIAQVTAMPQTFLRQMTQLSPQSAYVVDFVLRVRDQLLWLLLAAIVWVAMDKFDLRRQARRA